MTSKQATKSTNSSNYLPQLDGLRAIAIFGVMLTHLLHRGSNNEVLPLGAMGVQLFFVLSGFLITRILLQSRSYLDSKQQSFIFTIGQFYIRRFLRIFPLFYLTLALLWIFDIAQTRETIFWHSFYLSNIYFSLIGAGQGHVTHFWTLAVEEQWYLIWPIIVCLTPQKKLFPLIIVVIASAPIYRFFASLLDLNSMTQLFLPFANLDTLGLGALLALCWAYPERYTNFKVKLSKYGLFIATPLLIIFLIFIATIAKYSDFTTVFFRLVLGFFFFWLVDQAAIGFKGRIGKILSSFPIRWIGKISYGIYIIHVFTLDILHCLYGYYDLTRLNIYLEFCILSAMSILLASISWILFERPINRLKSNFPYKKLTA